MRKTNFYLQGTGIGYAERRGKRSACSRGAQQANFLAGGRYIFGRGSGAGRVHILKNTLKQGTGKKGEIGKGNKALMTVVIGDLTLALKIL